MDKSRSNDDTGSELLDSRRNHRVQSLERQFDQQHRSKHANRASNKDDEQRANTQRHIIVPVLDTA